MTDLVEWLRAQLDEDERAARTWLPFGNPDAAAREHVARHDPARVLAEVDARRRILGLHVSVDGVCTTCRKRTGPARYPCDTLLLLALPYADRPGYRDEWRPQ